MAKPTAAWGIDIGQCALKALRLELDDGKPTATAFDYIEHPKILSQPDADPEALTREALEKFLTRNALGNDLVAISVAGQSGLARFVKLPPVEPSKVAAIVQFEAKQQIPFPLDEVVWDYQTISGGDVKDNFAMDTEIGLFAMKRELIARVLGQFSAVNIEVHVVQMAPLALCNYANYEMLGKGGPDPVADDAVPDDTPRGKKRCVVVLDVGTDTSNLIITDGGKIIWQRPLALGGNSFTKALTKEMKLTFAKAEHLKRNAAKSPDLATILKSLRPVLTDFVGEVQRSLGYFTNTHRDAHIAYMVGLGSAFRLPGLQKYMTEKLSLDVRRPTSADRLAGDAVKSDPIFTENMLSFPVAYGLALQGLNGLGENKSYGRINTNLLPGEIRTDRLIRAKKPYAAAAAACLLLGTGGLALGYGVQYKGVNDDGIKKAITTSKSAIGTATSQAGEKTKGEEEVVKTQRDVKAIIDGADMRLDAVRMNEVLMAALPRHGEKGNLDADRIPYWNSDKGPDAFRLYNERIKKGLTSDRLTDDDMSEYLAQVNVESVYTHYTENLKGFLEKADTKALADYGRNIADTMLDSEKEMNTATPPRAVPKGPDGGGFVFQISGYTNHNLGNDFLVKCLVRNFQKADLFAQQTTTMVTDPKTNQQVPEVTYYLPGVSDPVKGRVSHVFLLLSKQVENPQPKVFQYLNQNYIDGLMPAAAATEAAPPPGGAPPPPADVRGSLTGAAAAGAAAGWTPIGGMSDVGGAPASGNSPAPIIAPPPTPTDPAAPKAKDAKPRFRNEFVLCFIWRDGAPAPVAPAP